MTIREYDTQACLIVLNMVDFNINLVMGWLYPYHTVLDCFAKIVTLTMPSISPFMWQGSFSHALMGIISYFELGGVVSHFFIIFKMLAL